MPTFETKQDVWEFFKRQIPDLFTKRKFNFITIHYLYIIGMAFFLSGIIHGIGGIDYVDALFFAAGSCTQSGLNTVDVNTLRLGQQVCFYLGAMFCNPIIIHSSVVFVRLYWFERRFKDIVKDARSLRRSRSRTKTMNLDPDDPERVRKELGVRGRAINILRHTGRTFRSPDKDSEQDDPVIDAKVEDQSESDRHGSDHASEKYGQDHEVDGDDDAIRQPAQLSPEQHIQFLEKQRNPRDSTALRIPSPREFEEGGRPESIDELNGGVIRRTTTRFDPNIDRPAPPSQRFTQHITIDEPQIHRDRTHTANFPRAASRQRATNLDPPEPRTGVHRRTNTGLSSIRRSNTVRSMEPRPYLSWQPTIGRNSFFVNLTEDQREELGGIEYRALKTLAYTLMAFFFGFHILGIICLTPWILHSSYADVVTVTNGQGRPWWGIFTAGSAFNDLGFTLTADSMLSFQQAVFPLLLMTFLIIIGNTGFPCMLRFVIWFCSKMVPVGSGIWEEFQFLLDHPRRCFTLLFPRGATWWLFAILVILNGVDLILFIILDLNDETVTSIPPGYRVLDGLFQAASTRTAGFSVVNLSNLHPAIQVSYLIMMYISVFPIAISMRRTNVYEEKSLGIYASPSDDDEDSKEPSYVGAHVRKQLSFDLWYIFLGLFVIAIVEGNNLENTNEYAFTMFSVLFEIVSAYGTVGLSLGYPTINASFSAKFHVISKLVIIAMMIRGRHRGLPYELDRAVLLPSEKLHEKEAKEGQRLMQRRMSLGSVNAHSMSAIDGELQGRFRAETGLSSSRTDAAVRHENENRGTEARLAEQHTKHARAGLGQTMYKLASASDYIPEIIKEDGHSGDSRKQD
jgi:Trk-type K+ transport system membrane component